MFDLEVERDILNISLYYKDHHISISLLHCYSKLGMMNILARLENNK